MFPLRIVHIQMTYDHIPLLSLQIDTFSVRYKDGIYHEDHNTSYTIGIKLVKGAYV